MSSLLKKLEASRLQAAKSVADFEFNKKRVRVLSNAKEVEPSAKAILYWMSREFRVQDNWSLLYAQRLSLKMNMPLHVVTFIYRRISPRHDKFFLGGLKEVAADLAELNIRYHLVSGEPTDHLVDLVKKHQFGAVVCDFFPLKMYIKWTDSLVKQLPAAVPFVQVDAHNIVPCWVTSEKQEYAARTIRFKITGKLSDYMTEFPPAVKQTMKDPIKAEAFDLDAELEQLDKDKMPELQWAKPGYRAGLEVLEEFTTKRIKAYGTKRNDPTADALSNLSPWFNYGYLSTQRCCMEVKALKSKHGASVDTFLEEAIVRRELSDNFCFYNPRYDSLLGASDWAQKTLKEHRADKREYVYTHAEFEEARTHEDLWNAAQLELVQRGKLHGFMRMYWAKKILEWSASPEEALRIALDLNDRYAIDGCNPNGFVGVMWSICGIHDQGWAERKVFGKIRYMNYAGCKRKFDVDRYVMKWKAKSYPYLPSKKAKTK